MKIFAGVADGSLVIFKRNEGKHKIGCFKNLPSYVSLLLFMFLSEGTWNFSEPKAVGLGKEPVMAIAVVTENLWCSCGNKLFVVDHDDETIKVASLFFSYQGSYRKITFVRDARVRKVEIGN